MSAGLGFPPAGQSRKPSRAIGSSGRFEPLWINTFPISNQGGILFSSQGRESVRYLLRKLKRLLRMSFPGQDCCDQTVRTGNPASDAYASEARLRDLPVTIWNLPRWLLLALIRGYQKVISPMLAANTCRFYPSCSHYGYQAIYKYGVLKGGLMAAWRVLRCNPFNPGGYDPVP